MRPVLRLLAAGLCLAGAASAVCAAQRSVAAGTSTAPSASTRSSFGAPQASGLTPVFPAGINSGSGALVSRDPIASSTAPVPGNSTTSVTMTTASGGVVTRVIPDLGSGDAAAAAASTAVLGAGATTLGPGQTVGGAGGFSATDVARSFFFADANHDGELTRAEFSRLGIRTLSFEQMDRNFDGVISRFEYEDSTR